jgi:hypothetical protein
LLTSIVNIPEQLLRALVDTRQIAARVEQLALPSRLDARPLLKQPGLAG